MNIDIMREWFGFDKNENNKFSAIIAFDMKK